MHSSGSPLIPLDLEFERTARALRKAVREATLDDKISEEEKLSSSFDSEEEFIIAAAQPLTRRDCCKRTDEGHVSRWFVLADPANFDIKNYVLSGSRENPFDGNGIRDPWAHLARFYETTSMCKPIDVTKDHVKLRLFRFSLIGRVNDWLVFLLNGAIRTWKRLVASPFLKDFFTKTQFTEHRAEIVSFEL